MGYIAIAIDEIGKRAMKLDWPMDCNESCVYDKLETGGRRWKNAN
jgi:hypothetical protein